MIIDSMEQVMDLKEKILKNAELTYEYFNKRMSTSSPIDIFRDMKFSKNGLDPIKGTPLNFIEQLNQMFSDLVVVAALEDLIMKYPDKQFEINFGAKSGLDIQSCDETVVAECFAVTSAKSNDKLRKDSKKLSNQAKNQEKYIYFYSENDVDEKLEITYQSFPEITFKRIKGF